MIETNGILDGYLSPEESTWKEQFFRLNDLMELIVEMETERRMIGSLDSPMHPDLQLIWERIVAKATSL